jgi:hypothetical protein
MLSHAALPGPQLGSTRRRLRQRIIEALLDGCGALRTYSEPFEPTIDTRRPGNTEPSLLSYTETGKVSDCQHRVL